MSKSTLEGDENDGLLAIFKGESGVGKTVGALSFPNVYVFDFDRKMPSIAKKHFPGKNIEYDTFEDVFQVDMKISDLRKYCPYETLVIDSFTGLGNLVFNTMASLKTEPGSVVIRRMANPKAEKVGIDYYFAENHFINHFIDQLKILHKRSGNPQHVIVIAHVIAYESAPDLRTKQTTKFRSILAQGRKPAAILPTEFDDVYIFGLQRSDNAFDSGVPKVERICITESFGEDPAKCSFNFPDCIDFTNTSLYEKMFFKPPIKLIEKGKDDEGL
jgi:hypothetical protein